MPPVLQVGPDVNPYPLFADILFVILYEVPTRPVALAVQPSAIVVVVFAFPTTLFVKLTFTVPVQHPEGRLVMS